MISQNLSSIILLPFLALISIPLILSAYITTVLSFFAICIRFSLIYIELCYAIISNYFVIPTPTDSLLSFTASAPPTPGSISSNTVAGKSPGAGAFPASIPRSASAQHLPFYQPCRLTRPGAKRFNSSMSLVGHDAHAKAMHDRTVKSRTSPGMIIAPPTPLLGLISGDEGRDFEDMGGWRHSRYKPSSSSSPPAGDPSPGNEEDQDDSADSDERAWLSLNQRLELPSQAFTQYSSPQENFGYAWTTPSAGKHHKRSSTTSMLASSTRFGSGLSLVLSNRPLDTPVTSTPTSPVDQRMSVSPNTGKASRDGGYFALRPHSSGGRYGGSATITPRAGTGAGEEKSPGFGRFMAHYSVGVRHRRRSTSGLPRGFGRDGIR